MTGDDRALDPDDLDFTEDDRVRELEEDRYIVSADGSPKTGDPQPSTPDEVAASSEAQSEPPPDAITQAAVSRWLATSFKHTGFAYGFDATLAVDDDVVRHRLVSNDLPTTFETLVTWFLQNATANATIDEALGILLDASDLRVTYPPARLHVLVERHGLSPDDSIAELLAAVDAEDGIHFGPDPDD